MHLSNQKTSRAHHLLPVCGVYIRLDPSTVDPLTFHSSKSRACGQLWSGLKEHRRLLVALQSEKPCSEYGHNYLRQRWLTWQMQIPSAPLNETR
jgi:hypothetical protein